MEAVRDVLLSICIPTYNRAEIVCKCVENCLRIEKNWIDVVVVDNCSTDNTFDKLSGINHERLKVKRNKTNLGYVNLMKCLSEGDGQYCLLLSDEDDFFDTNWDEVEKQLRSDSDTTIYQFHYEDENGKILVRKPKKLYKSGVYPTLKLFLYNFAFAGGLIVQREAFLKGWETAYKPEYLWSLYSEAIVPMYVSMLGNYKGVNNLKVRRSERNNSGDLDTNAWKGKGREPYWTIHSREKQNVEWMEVISHLNVDRSTRKKLTEEVINKYMKEIGNYYYIVNVYKETETASLFTKSKWVIERDRAIPDKEWKAYYLEKLKYIKEECKKYDSSALSFRCRIKSLYGYARLLSVMFLKGRKKK